MDDNTAISENIKLMMAYEGLNTIIENIESDETIGKYSLLRNLYILQDKYQNQIIKKMQKQNRKTLNSLEDIKWRFEEKELVKVANENKQIKVKDKFNEDDEQCRNCKYICWCFTCSTHHCKLAKYLGGDGICKYEPRED